LLIEIELNCVLATQRCNQEQQEQRCRGEVVAQSSSLGIIAKREETAYRQAEKIEVAAAGLGTPILPSCPDLPIDP
jgi:hypothetical protein